jgi:hypothetical protein
VIGTNPGVRRLPIGWPSGVIVAVGVGVFVAASTRRNEELTMAGAAITSAGLVALPIELALRSRLASLHRGLLVLGAVLIVQGLHTVEHVVQIIQSYRLDRVGARSLGVVSGLNVEWVHFGWNWLAWLGVVFAWRLGVRGFWMLALILWITAHSLEHTYMLWHYLSVTSKLNGLGLPRSGASQVLPGILGRDGWLARDVPATRRVLGPLVAAPRVAVHFWWNVGEVSLLVAATRMHRLVAPRNTSSRATSPGSQPTAPATNL